MFRSHRYCFWLTIICCDMPKDSWLAIISTNTMTLKKTACDDSLILELVFQPFHSSPSLSLPLCISLSLSLHQHLLFLSSAFKAQVLPLSLPRHSCAWLTNPFNLDFNYHVSFVIRLCPPGIKLALSLFPFHSAIRLDLMNCDCNYGSYWICRSLMTSSVSVHSALTLTVSNEKLV